MRPKQNVLLRFLILTFPKFKTLEIIPPSATEMNNMQGYIQPDVDRLVLLDCSVDGIPAPEIVWFKVPKITPLSHSLSFIKRATPSLFFIYFWPF